MKKMQLEDITVSKKMVEKNKDELIYVKVTPDMINSLESLCKKLGMKGRARAKVIRLLLSQALEKVKVVA
jgi:phage terminase small subunit